MSTVSPEQAGRVRAADRLNYEDQGYAALFLLVVISKGQKASRSRECIRSKSLYPDVYFQLLMEHFAVF